MKSEQLHTRLFPNPAKDCFTVLADVAEKTEVSIMDINGRLVTTRTIHGSAVFNTADFRDGVYSVLIRGSKGSSYSKLVVLG